MEPLKALALRRFAPIMISALCMAGCSSGAENAAEQVGTTTSTTEAERPDPTEFAVFSREIRDPAPPVEPSPIHAVGLVETLPNEDENWGEGLAIFTDDLVSVGSLGCTPGTPECDPAGLLALQAAGIDVINVATRSVSAADASDLENFLATAADLEMTVIGVQPDQDSPPSPVVISRDGVQVALVAIDLNDAEPSDVWPKTTTANEFDAVLEAIARTASQDIPTVVFADWGNPGDRAATTAQVEVAELLLDGGAAAVVGNGPGLLQRFQQTGGNVVAFNLGRSTSGGAGTELDTAIVRLNFTGPSPDCLLPATATPNGPVLARVDSTAPCA